jgi:MarR family protein
VLRARDLGRMVGWERSQVFHQVTRMEKRGLVAREECSEDARGSMVRLTDAGPRSTFPGSTVVADESACREPQQCGAVGSRDRVSGAAALTGSAGQSVARDGQIGL